MANIYLAFEQEEREKYLEILVGSNLDSTMFQEHADDDTEIILGAPNLIVDLLPKVPNLKWVQASWAGVEPLVLASKKNYILTNARGIFGQLISEFVFGYILFIEKNIQNKLDSQKQKIWDRELPTSLSGKTIGLLGVGSIGSEIARIAKAFNLTVRGYTASTEGSLNVDHYFHGENIYQFAMDLDYLVCILPNTTKTKNLVDRTFLANLPSRCIVFNVGRGQTLDELALADMLETGKLRGAVLDVFKHEPLPVDSPLWHTKNLYVTGHTSGPSFAENVANLFLENLRLYQEHKQLKYQVDFDKEY